MDNHVHLLIETGKVPLSKILQGVNQRFTMYFNWKYGTVGHLFQGRYKAILSDRDAYLLGLVKYLHRNPVRAGMVTYPEEYPWSSHREYIRPIKDGLVNIGLVLGMFSKKMKNARKLYSDFVREEEKTSQEDFYRTVDQRVLGDDDFVAWVRGRAIGRPLTGRRSHQVRLTEIARGIEDLFGIPLEKLREKGKDPGVMEGRRLLSLVAQEYGYKGKEIAAFLGKDPAAVSEYLRKDQHLRGKMERLVSVLEGVRSKSQ